MRRLLLLIVIGIYSSISYGQNCTVTGTSPLNWTNPGPACVEGGNAGANTVLIIPAGFTVVFDNNSDTWTGTRIDVYGTLTIDADVTINADIVVYGTGRVNLQSKLSLGTAAGCGYDLSIRTNGKVDVGGTGSDRLNICGVDIMKGNGACNSCGGTNSGACAYNGNPYCEPTGGFTGPLGYNQGGYSAALPITLINLSSQQNKNNIELRWATLMELNFDKFLIERSNNGKDFTVIGEQKGNGNSNTRIDYSYIDKSPLIGKNYYRLKALDLDASFEYSPLVVTDFDGPKNISVYPNPSDGNTVFVLANFENEEEATIQVFDNLGVKVRELTTDGIENKIYFNSLKQGSYLLKYTSAKHSQVVRFSVK